MILDEAEALLDPVSDIEGFMLACLVDASTGMDLASGPDVSACGAAEAADIASVLAELTGELPVDGLEDVMVTFRQSDLARLAAVLGEKALADAVATLRALSAALDELQPRA